MRCGHHFGTAAASRCCYQLSRGMQISWPGEWAEGGSGQRGGEMGECLNREGEGERWKWENHSGSGMKVPLPWGGIHNDLHQRIIMHTVHAAASVEPLLFQSHCPFVRWNSIGLPCKNVCNKSYQASSSLLLLIDGDVLVEHNSCSAAVQSLNCITCQRWNLFMPQRHATLTAIPFSPFIMLRMRGAWL